MVLESKKLFFKTIFLIFEDNKALEVMNSGRYSSVVIISRQDFPLLSKYKRTKTTSVINLTIKMEEIFHKFNDTTRNEVRKTESMPDLKIVSEDLETALVYQLYKDFERIQGRTPFPKGNMKDCLIFSAYFKGELISVMYVDKGGKDLRVRYIFSKRLKTNDPELYKIIGYATKRLIWEVCLYGKRNNFLSLDMATVNFQDKNKEGITKFKMSFGGKLADEYTYIYKSKTFSYFEKLAILKNYLRKILN